MQQRHLTLAYPLLCIGLLYGQWLLSWAVLGHQSQPSLDDPKLIDGASWMHLFTTLAFLGFIPIAFIGVALNVIYMIDRRLKGYKALRYILLFLTFWLGTFQLLRSDPGSILIWWFD